MKADAILKVDRVIDGRMVKAGSRLAVIELPVGRSITDFAVALKANAVSIEASNEEKRGGRRTKKDNDEEAEDSGTDE